MTANRPGPRVLVVFNPVAGWRRQRRLNLVLERLRARGCRLTVHPTRAAGDATVRAAAADPADYDLVVAAGGDGTINEMINGLPANAPPLAIIPLGSANVLAAEIGLSADPEQIAETIVAGVPRPVALGSANGRRFLLMAGAGFDAQVVTHVSTRVKRWLGKGAYAVAIIGQLWRFGFPTYRVETEHGSWTAASVLVANARFYGGKFVCAPAASLLAPTFEVCLFERRGRLSAIGYALALFAGLLPRLASYRIVTAARVSIHGPADEPVQGDGDVIAHLQTDIVALPGALTLMFPAGTAADGRTAA